ncbi:hypothetical protein QCA50_005457 [Cerrena zonata]|uniref:Uncharacterized protein n=1 Tax=Cerrena zonata TaxID=2478898 RepID=A0AAW0GQ59_9APHY
MIHFRSSLYILFAAATTIIPVLSAPLGMSDVGNLPLPITSDHEGTNLDIRDAFPLDMTLFLDGLEGNLLSTIEPGPAAAEGLSATGAFEDGPDRQRVTSHIVGCTNTFKFLLSEYVICL